MKALEWKNQKGEWEVHYRRPNDHPDVKDWEKKIATQETQNCFGDYRIVEV